MYYLNLENYISTSCVLKYTTFILWYSFSRYFLKTTLQYFSKQIILVITALLVWSFEFVLIRFVYIRFLQVYFDDWIQLKDSVSGRIEKNNISQFREEYVFYVVWCYVYNIKYLYDKFSLKVYDLTSV